LIGIFRQFFHFTVADAELRIEELQVELEKFGMFDVVDHSLSVVH